MREIEKDEESQTWKAGASPAAADMGAGGAHRPAPPPFNQLKQFLSFLEYIIDNPPGPYRPARLAVSLGASESRVRRWLLLLAESGWLRRVKHHYFQSERFDAWGRAYVGQIFDKGATK